MTAWLRSLEGQVALRLTVVFIFGTALGVTALLYEGTQGTGATGAGFGSSAIAEISSVGTPG